MADLTVREGTAVKITGTFTDADSTAFDPDDVYVSYTNPAGTTTTASYNGGAGDVSKDGTGIYSFWMDTRASGAGDGVWTVTMYSDDTTTSSLVSERKTIDVTPADAVSS
jgi:hypothetical protein